jgi:DNA-binding HxlR family transcriptional regulator
MQVYEIGAYMTSQPPDSIELTPQGQILLDALREAGDWVNRSAIAKIAGKSALNKWDLVLLERLVEVGLIETKQIPRHGPIGYEWRYRAVQPDQDAEQDQ